MSEQKEDLINDPDHYKLYKCPKCGTWVEVINVIEAVVKNVRDGIEATNVGHCIRYVLRYQGKGGLESLKKNHYYLARLIGYIEERNRTYGNIKRKD
jgi:hypothetical protein